jgi:ketosteroid isomerase-like protein
MSSNWQRLGPLFRILGAVEENLEPTDLGRILAGEATLRDLVAPELEVAFIGPDPLFRNTYDGVEGFMQGWSDWLEAFTSFRLELEYLIESGEVVVTMVRQFATPAGTSTEIETEGGAAWWFQQGQVRRVEFHLDREQALEAAEIDPDRAERIEP